jgi:energy-coupling factor transport system ATP-binding protein
VGLDLPTPALLANRLRPLIPNLPSTILTIDQLAAALGAPPTGCVRRSTDVASAQGDLGALSIAVKELSHTYMRDTPFARSALDHVNLSVAEGSAHGIIGATGAGKSTLLQHLNGLLRPQGGSVEVAGLALQDPHVDVRKVRRLAGLVFQLPEAQIFEQYVGDEIAYGPRLAGVAGADLRDRVRWAMEMVGLDFEAYRDRLTFALSGGEKRKVALASTLALQPRILLLDEPTAGLDPHSRRELLLRLQDLHREGMTLVVSSHQMDEIARLAGRVTVMDTGETVLTGTSSAVYSQAEALHRWGLEQPLATQAATRLRDLGWPLDPGVLTLETLTSQVAACL